MKFWDSSAIVPLLLEDEARAGLLTVLGADTVMVVWWAAPVECASAIARLEREGALALSGANEALARLSALEPAWIEVTPSTELRRVAIRLLRTHVLRAADAAQLAAAIIAAEHDPASLDFVSLDARLNDAASREGFRIVGG